MEMKGSLQRARRATMALGILLILCLLKEYPSYLIDDILQASPEQSVLNPVAGRENR